jgi:uncharacterized protein (DUF362 family)
MNEHLEISKVALLITKDRMSGIPTILNALQLNSLYGKTVLLKPNLNSDDPFPGSTHLDTLRTLVIYIKEQGAKRIILGDRSGMGSTRIAMRNLGIFELSEELDFDVMVFDELPQEEWEKIHFSESHWRNGFAIPRIVNQVDAVIQTCCLKTHRFGGHFTMSLKNSVGLVAKRIPGEKHNFMHELHLSPHQRKMIAEINACYIPDFVLLDGIDAFVKGGPAKGKLVSPNILLAGKDRVAIDAIGVAILRKFGSTRQIHKGPIFELDQLSRAAALGLGASSARQIEIITLDNESRLLSEELLNLLI